MSQRADKNTTKEGGGQPEGATQWQSTGIACIKHQVSSPTPKKERERKKVEPAKSTGMKTPGSTVHSRVEDQALLMPCEQRGWEDIATEQHTEQGCFLLPSAALL